MAQPNRDLSGTVNTNFSGAKSFVKMKRGQKQESLSGPGSWLKNAADSIDFINRVIQKHKVRSILDLGCGDWNWFKEIQLTGVDYVGWDADELMIRENRARYGSGSKRFEVKDIVLEDYLEVDLIICRDVLFHMDMDLARRVIANTRGKCKHFLSTSFREVTANSGPQRYTDFDQWGYYNINLNIEPFNLQAAEVDYCEERTNRTAGARRFICLFEFDAPQN